MIDKIKAWLSAAKEALLVVVLPIVALVGYISYLLKQNSKLENELAQAQSEKELATDSSKEEQDEKKADDLEAEYNKLNAELDSGSGDGTKPPAKP